MTASDSLPRHLAQGMPQLLNNVLLNYIHDSVTITDGRGILLNVSASCEENFGFDARDYIGKPIELLVQKGIFSPCVTLMVLEQGKKVTGRQPNKQGIQLFVTGIPIHDEKGAIVYVVSFSSWDIQSMEELEEKYLRIKRDLCRCSSENRALRSKLIELCPVVAESRAMKKLCEIVQRIAPYTVPVLITGESGVGKSYLARILHKESLRRTGPFIEINCSTIPGRILETELFGDPRHSAEKNWEDARMSALELAQSGTLFISEVDNLPLDLQLRLVTFFKQTRDPSSSRDAEGASDLDVRLIASSQKDLKQMVQEGEFREELFYLLNTIPLKIPPLRERPDDTLALILHFLENKNKAHKLNKRFTQQALDMLLDYNWPGNIREIESVIERVLLTSPDTVIQSSNIPDFIASYARNLNDKDFNLKNSLEFYEKRIILQAFEQYKTTTATARALGISQPSVVRKLKKYNTNKGKKR